MREKDNIWNNDLPFEVPDGYFENFEGRIKSILEKDSDRKSTPTGKVSMFAPWVGLAAAFLIIALVYRQLPERFFPDHFSEQTTEEPIIIEIYPSDLIGEYELLEYITELEHADIELFPDSLFFREVDEDDLIMLTLFR